MRHVRLYAAVGAAVFLQAPGAIASTDTGQVLRHPGGAQFAAAAGWSVQRDTDMVRLSAPEQDATFAIITLAAPNARSALDQAWTRFRPGVKRAPHSVQREAARNGWDERATGRYDAPPNVAISTVALRKGAVWTVALLEGAGPTVQKRSAAVSLLFSSLRPDGYVDETFAGRKANRLDAERIRRITGFLDRGMKRLKITGISFALLQDGKIVHVQGLGVRRHGRPEKVDQDTLFMAASNTKSLTTLLLAALADDGKLKWDQPVTDLYPSFKLGDPDTTAKVHFKHLVCACTGLPRQDMEMMFEFGNATPASSLALLAKVHPTSNFGELYQYSNLMASAAGYIAGALAYPGLEIGTAYDRAMQERIFKPLGMRRTTFDMPAALKGNHAAPHTLDRTGALSVTGTEMDASINPHRPAGGAWTTAHDFIRYVQLEASEGVLENGARLVSRANLLARRAPQIVAGEGVTYGMGLESTLVNGVKVLNHGGSLPGYKSNFFLLPEAGTGAVLLTNSDMGYALLSAFRRYLLEELYDGKPEAEEDVRIAVDAVAAWYARAGNDVSVPPAPSAVRGLAAHYRSAELGDLAVTRQGRHTFLDAGEWKTAVGTRKNNDGSFSLSTIIPGLGGFEFVIGSSAAGKTLSLHAGQQVYVFKEVADKR